MPKPCLIAIDIDGTLLGPDGQVSERNRAALHRAERAGVEIVIATGRRHAYAMRVLRSLDLPAHRIVISSNGTVLRTVGAELVHRTPMPLRTVRWLAELLGDFRDTFVLTFDNVGPDGEDRRGALVCENLDALHASIGAWMRSNDPFLRQVDRIEDALDFDVPLQTDPLQAAALPAAPIQAMLCGTVDRMAAAEARLAAHPTVAGVGQPTFPGCAIALHRTTYPDRDLAILDILPAGCSKASALAHLAALRGCTLHDVLAIGDNWNDLPMLRAAGQAVLMGNAPADLHTLAHQLGWTIGPTNGQDGVAQAIENALLDTPS